MEGENLLQEIGVPGTGLRGANALEHHMYGDSWTFLPPCPKEVFLSLPQGHWKDFKSALLVWGLKPEATFKAFWDIQKAFRGPQEAVHGLLWSSEVPWWGCESTH